MDQIEGRPPPTQRAPTLRRYCVKRMSTNSTVNEAWAQLQTTFRWTQFGNQRLIIRDDDGSMIATKFDTYDGEEQLLVVSCRYSAGERQIPGTVLKERPIAEVRMFCPEEERATRNCNVQVVLRNVALRKRTDAAAAPRQIRAPRRIFSYATGWLSATP